MIDIASLIGRSEAARRLRVSGEMVSIWMRRGKLPSIATANGRLLDPADVEKLGRERETMKAESARGVRVE
jgi:predicted site-specific integrase-resolvase